MEPISTYVDFGDREFLVADERGYDYLLYKMAEDFLFTSEGKILDDRLKLNKVLQFLVINTLIFFSLLKKDILLAPTCLSVSTLLACLFASPFSWGEKKSLCFYLRLLFFPFCYFVIFFRCLLLQLNCPVLGLVQIMTFQNCF